VLEAVRMIWNIVNTQRYVGTCASASASALFASCVLLSPGVHATQVVEGATERHVEVNISARENNRLAVLGRQIATVVPSTKGAITYQKDEAQGALYFALSPALPGGATVTLFVGDEQGQTYKVILVPKSIPGEEIILQPPAARGGFLGDRATDGNVAATTRTTSYQRRAKELTLAMAENPFNTRQDKVVINQEVPLWKEGRLVFVSKVVDSDLVGETYRLTNVSPAPMVLTEQELYRKGVRSVVVEFHTLEPGAASDIFIVRDRKSHE